MGPGGATRVSLSSLAGVPAVVVAPEVVVVASVALVVVPATVVIVVSVLDDPHPATHASPQRQHEHRGDRPTRSAGGGIFSRVCPCVIAHQSAKSILCRPTPLRPCSSR